MYPPLRHWPSRALVGLGGVEGWALGQNLKRYINAVVSVVNAVKKENRIMSRGSSILPAHLGIK